jgi:hypothetical protein
MVVLSISFITSPLSLPRTKFSAKLFCFFDQRQRDGERERERERGGERNHFIQNKNAAEADVDIEEDLQQSNIQLLFK